MDELLPTDSENSERIALDFYANEFNQAIAVTQPKQSVGQGCEKGKGKRNPHLPCNQSGISKGGNDEPDQMGGTGCRGF